MATTLNKMTKVFVCSATLGFIFGCMHINAAKAADGKPTIIFRYNTGGGPSSINPDIPVVDLEPQAPDRGISAAIFTATRSDQKASTGHLEHDEYLYDFEIKFNASDDVAWVEFSLIAKANGYYRPRKTTAMCNIEAGKNVCKFNDAYNIQKSALANRYGEQEFTKDMAQTVTFEVESLNYISHEDGHVIVNDKTIKQYPVALEPQYILNPQMNPSMFYSPYFQKNVHFIPLTGKVQNTESFSETTINIFESLYEVLKK